MATATKSKNNEAKESSVKKEFNMLKTRAARRLFNYERVDEKYNKCKDNEKKKEYKLILNAYSDKMLRKIFNKLRIM